MRTYSTEVFVGMMIPTNTSDIFVIQGTTDPVLEELMYCARHHYINYYEYDSLATVTIVHSNDSTLLSHTGFGIYRDVQRDLSVVAGHSYELVVQTAEGDVWRATTTVPELPRILFPDSDTLRRIPDAYDGIKFPILIDSVSGSSYYVLVHQQSNFPSFSAYLYATELGRTITMREFNTTQRLTFVTCRDEIRAVNQAYALFHTPCGGNSVSPAFFEFEKSLYEMSIEERSNMTGEQVVGVFGAYSAAVNQYVVQALWDSVSHSSQRPPNRL